MEDAQVRGQRLHPWDELHRRGTGADDPDAFTGEVVAVVPAF